MIEVTSDHLDNLLVGGLVGCLKFYDSLAQVFLVQSSFQFTFRNDCDDGKPIKQDRLCANTRRAEVRNRGVVIQ